MTRHLKSLTIILLSYFILIASSAWIAPVFAQDASMMQREINAYRQRRALPVTIMEPRLRSVAESIARTIAQDGSHGFERVNLDSLLKNKGYSYRQVQTLVGLGEARARTVLAEWHKERRYRRGLTLPDAKHIGIALLQGKGALSHQPAGPIWVVLMAEPTKQVAGNWREGIRKYVNIFRKSYGLKPLRLNSRLNRAAQRHADDMAVRDYFEHLSPEGTGPGKRATAAGYRWQRVLENLAGGQINPEQVVEGWKASKQGHREAMLDREIIEMGVGYRYYPNDDGRARFGHYWAMTMGKPRN